MVKVIKPGFYTTVQDLGRFGFREFGVPVSGGMDNYSSRFANAILGNPENAAVLELTMTGPVLEFQKPTQISISGANMSVTVNDSPAKMNAAIHINSNDILKCGQLTNGLRSYLAISGGFVTPTVMGSKSMFRGITDSGRLNAEDTLDFSSSVNTISNKNASLKYNATLLNESYLEVYKGPEFNHLSAKNQKELLNLEFKVSRLNNRMAYQLQPLLQNGLKSILTTPVLPGTVQLTPSGQLIVLMRDCQSTGGYPRILQLTEKSIDILSQKSTNNIIKFRLKV